jgi:uncharacterized membrane protein YiaA
MRERECVCVCVYESVSNYLYVTMTQRHARTIPSHSRLYQMKHACVVRVLLLLFIMTWNDALLL